VERVSGRGSVLHLKNFHPLNDWYGLSAVEAAAYSIDQHNQSGAWNQALLQNGARPSGALVVRPESPGGGTLSEDQYNRVKLQIDEQFSGAANAGRPILLEGGLDWKEMSLTPKDMDFIQAKNSAARDIALAFGVPPQLLGIPGDNTYSNLQEARLALWEQTVIPLVQATTDALNNWLVPMFDANVELVPDTDNISVLATRNQAVWDRVQAATFLTVNEKRAAVGYPPVVPQMLKSKRRSNRAKGRVVRARKDDDLGDDGDDGTYYGLDNSDTPENLEGNDAYGLDALGVLAGMEGALGSAGAEGVDEGAGVGPAMGMDPESAAALADQIAAGHAYDDHVVDDGHFPDINTPEEFSDHIEGILTDPGDVKDLRNDRTGYWDDETGTVVIHDPNNEDGGTAFVPDYGDDYFDVDLN